MKTLKIAHLYPKLLNIYGDIGNIIAIKKRCEWQGVNVQINEIDIGDSIFEHDFYFIGGGQDFQQKEVATELLKHKDFFIAERDKMKVFLGICGGYQLLGKFYQQSNGEKIQGIELLDAYTISGKKRFIGNVTAMSEFVEPNTLVGFENHIGQTFLESNTIPLAQVKVGNGNNGNDLSEGARYKNVFGTYLHGAFLPKNPHFADYLIELAIGAKPEKLNDFIEFEAHNCLINKSY